jgi:hypothetical protein
VATKNSDTFGRLMRAALVAKAIVGDARTSIAIAVIVSRFMSFPLASE